MCSRSAPVDQNENGDLKETSRGASKSMPSHGFLGPAESFQKCLRGPPQRLPEKAQRTSPEAPPESPFWDPLWCQNGWFSISFTTKTKACAIMEREARKVEEMQYADNRKERMCQSSVLEETDNKYNKVAMRNRMPIRYQR